jgi:hypothetical protein
MGTLYIDASSSSVQQWCVSVLTFVIAMALSLIDGNSMRVVADGLVPVANGLLGSVSWLTTHLKVVLLDWKQE